MVIKIWFIGVIISLAAMYSFDKITRYLGGKSKDNRFRQWWSNYICDLDNKY
jgi:hypothetical protein